MGYTLVGWIPEVTKLSAANFLHMDQGIAAAHALAQPPRVTALPGSPAAGDVIDFIPDPMKQHIRWRLVYTPTLMDGSPNPSPYKWECVGGSPLSDFVAASQSTASAAYTDLATVGPVVTLPLAGDYDVTHGFMSGADSAIAKMSYAIGAAAAAEADHVRVKGLTGNVHAHVARTRRKTGLPAAALTAKYLASGGTLAFEDRFITAMPQRVG